jgi:hypothetical protein
VSRREEKRQEKADDNTARDARDEATIRQLREALRTGKPPPPKTDR